MNLFALGSMDIAIMIGIHHGSLFINHPTFDYLNKLVIKLEDIDVDKVLYMNIIDLLNNLCYTTWKKYIMVYQEGLQT